MWIQKQPRGLIFDRLTLSLPYGQSTRELADEYDLPLESIKSALAYYQTHQEEIDTLIRIEQEIEAKHANA
jgi:hypothetical protein